MKTIRLTCKECNQSTPHHVIRQGGKTVYTCIKCGRRTVREGSVS